MSDYFKFSKPRWQVLEDKKVCKTTIFSVHQLKIKPDQKDETADFFVLKAPEWTNVIALTPENQIVLVEQYRAGIHEPSLEIPGGVVDPGEEPLQAAKRELLEETGFRSGNWKPIGKTSSNPAIFTNYTHLYLAENCEKVQDQQTDGNEDIRIHLMSLNEFLNLVKNGTVHHSLVLAAIAQFLLMD